MRFNPQDWKEKSHSNFEGAWHEGPSVVTPPGGDKKYPRVRVHTGAGAPDLCHRQPAA